MEKDEDGYYIASVPMLPGCHTQAKGMDALRDRIKEAIEAYLEAGKDIEISELAIAILNRDKRSISMLTNCPKSGIIGMGNHVRRPGSI